MSDSETETKIEIENIMHKLSLQGKKSSNPKINIVEPGKSIRTKKKRPIDKRIGWDNGRSRKNISRSHVYRNVLQVDKSDVNIDRFNKAEIKSALNRDIKIIYPMAPCSYRRILGGEYDKAINCCARLEAISNLIDPISDQPNSDILIDKNFALSPSNNDLIVMTSYKDKSTGKNLRIGITKIIIHNKKNI